VIKPAFCHRAIDRKSPTRARNSHEFRHGASEVA
jgi:hypothetical protein